MTICNYPKKGTTDMKLFLMLFLIISLEACAFPLLLGVKSYQSGDTKIDFITGGDFTMGANGVDTINNTRGIAPGYGAQR